MFFALIFLILAAILATVFPEWSAASTLLVAAGSVLALRLALAWGRRGKASPSDSD